MYAIGKQAITGLAVVVILATWLTTQAQEPGQTDPAKVAMQVSESRQENQKAARQYSWTSRTEVKVKGEVKKLRTEIVRYTVDGQLQRTPIGSSPEPKKKRGIRGRVQKKKATKMKEWGVELQALLHQYSLPTPGKLLDYLNQATIGRGETQGTIRILGRNVVKPGDELTMWVDSGTKQVKKTKVRTTLDGDTVLMELDHATI